MVHPNEMAVVLGSPFIAAYCIVQSCTTLFYHTNGRQSLEMGNNSQPQDSPFYLWNWSIGSRVVSGGMSFCLKLIVGGRCSGNFWTEMDRSQPGKR
jgi:hypothetical protein